MHDHYDRLENRSPAARESALFRDLRHVLSIARSRAPALRAQLKGIDPATILTRADLARVPERRAADVLALQAEAPPFGGLAAARLGALAHAFTTPGAPLSIDGPAKDWWGMARALYAAGLRKGVAVLNCFAYDLCPLGHMIESGARVIGCPVVPGGSADLDRKVDAVARLKPRAYCGDALQLKALLDLAAARGVDVSCLAVALVDGAPRKGLRSELALRNLDVRHIAITPDLGPIAYQSGDETALVVNEGLIVEIVDAATRLPVAEGAEGELVVTRLNPDYPLLRYATGLRTKQLAAAASCGRTNMRIAGPREIAPACVEFDEACVHISQIEEIARRHPEVGRLRACMRRPRDRDELVLEVEHRGDVPDLSAARDLDARLRETLRVVARVAGTIELVRPGTLADDDPVIVDERPLN